MPTATGEVEIGIHMKIEAPYHSIVVESFCPENTSGLHGPVHVRPATHQIFPQSLLVECPKELVNTESHPVGTKFRLKVKLTDRKGGGEYLYNSYKWKYDVVSNEEFERLYPQSRGCAT